MQGRGGELAGDLAGGGEERYSKYYQLTNHILSPEDIYSMKERALRIYCSSNEIIALYITLFVVCNL